MLIEAKRRGIAHADGRPGGRAVEQRERVFSRVQLQTETAAGDYNAVQLMKVMGLEVIRLAVSLGKKTH